MAQPKSQINFLFLEVKSKTPNSKTYFTGQSWLQDIQKHYWNGKSLKFLALQFIDALRVAQFYSEYTEYFFSGNTGSKQKCNSYHIYNHQ